MPKANANRPDRPEVRWNGPANTGVIGMKVLGEGGLRNRVDEALHFVLGLDCVDCFTIGAANRDELTDLIRNSGWPPRSEA